MCFVLVFFMVCSSVAPGAATQNMLETWLTSYLIFFHKNKMKCLLWLCLCVTRIFAGPQPVIHWGWLTLGPCVTRRGAAPSLKTMACPPLSQLPTNLVRKLCLIFVKCQQCVHHQRLNTHIMHFRFMLMHIWSQSEICSGPELHITLAWKVKGILQSGLTDVYVHNQCGNRPGRRALQLSSWSIWLWFSVLVPEHCWISILAAI